MIIYIIKNNKKRYSPSLFFFFFHSFVKTFKRGTVSDSLQYWVHALRYQKEGKNGKNLLKKKQIKCKNSFSVAKYGCCSLWNHNCHYHSVPSSRLLYHHWGYLQKPFLVLDLKNKTPRISTLWFHLNFLHLSFLNIRNFFVGQGKFGAFPTWHFQECKLFWFWFLGCGWI